VCVCVCVCVCVPIQLHCDFWLKCGCIVNMGSFVLSSLVFNISNINSSHSISLLMFLSRRFPSSYVFAFSPSLSQVPPACPACPAFLACPACFASPPLPHTSSTSHLRPPRPPPRAHAAPPSCALRRCCTCRTVSWRRALRSPPCRRRTGTCVARWRLRGHQSLATKNSQYFDHFSFLTYATNFLWVKRSGIVCQMRGQIIAAQ
jgi:hypothetical protein